MTIIFLLKFVWQIPLNFSGKFNILPFLSLHLKYSYLITVWMSFTLLRCRIILRKPLHLLTYTRNIKVNVFLQGILFQLYLESAFNDTNFKRKMSSLSSNSSWIKFISTTEIWRKFVTSKFKEKHGYLPNVLRGKNKRCYLLFVSQYTSFCQISFNSY